MNALKSLIKIVQPCQTQSCIRQMCNVPIRRERFYNRVTILGRVGQDAELREKDGKKVCIFRVATDSTHFNKVKEEYVTRANWHRIAVLNPALAENIASKIRKGDRVFLAGELRENNYTNPDGTLTRTVDIIPNEIINLTNKHYKEDIEDDEEKNVG